MIITICRHTFSVQNSKKYHKASFVDLFTLNILKVAKTAFLTPERYNEHSPLVQAGIH